MSSDPDFRFNVQLCRDPPKELNSKFAKGIKIQVQEDQDDAILSATHSIPSSFGKLRYTLRCFSSGEVRFD